MRAKPFLLVTAGLAGLFGLLMALYYFAAPVTPPNVVGDSLDEAAAKLDDAGIHVDIDGAHGTVTAQSPGSEQQWFRYQDFEITYEDESGTHTIRG